MKNATLFENQPAIEISDGPNSVFVAPEQGANVLFWQRETREIISRARNVGGKVRGGDPILFPFIARHFVDGKRDFWRGLDGTVRPMPMHGFARTAKFTIVEDGAENSLRMRLTDSEQTRPLYPFAFQFDVVVTLHTGSRLEIRFETTNRGTSSMPYDAGHHFYLAVPHQERADWALELPCASWGWQNPDGSIRQAAATESVLRLDDPALIDRFQIQPLDADVTLLNARAERRLVFELKHPGSVPWYAITTWTEFPESDFFCVEPWLGLPNAIHHGQGLRHLAPGQTETATCIINANGW
jgi:galactose mutarotase-like enzyme